MIFLCMNLTLTTKNAIICGSTQGLGFASAIELALLGANVTHRLRPILTASIYLLTEEDYLPFNTLK